MKYTFQFKDFIDPDNEYHCWMYSIGLALSDLITINQILNEEFTAEKNRKEVQSRAFFLFKIGVGFLREAIKLHNSYHNQWEDYHRKIDGYEDLYKQIEDFSKDRTLKGMFNSIKLKDVKKARDNIFHYVTGECDKDKLVTIINHLKKENPDFSVTFRTDGDILTYSYPFSEEVQFQGFFDFYTYPDAYGLSEKNQDLLKLMLIYIKILKVIIDDFIIKRAKELDVKTEYD